MTVQTHPNPISNSQENGSLLAVIDRCPPFAVYYGCNLLLSPGQRLTVGRMAQMSGLSERTILRTAYRTSWKGVKTGVVDKFCRACGVDILNPDAVLHAVRAEIEKPEPFKEAPPQRRRAMLAHFNQLSAKAAIIAARER